MGLFDWIRFTGDKELEAVFGGRAPLTPEEFYIKYFQDQGYSKDLVIRVKEAFDSVIDFDLSRLGSHDDFSNELRFIWDCDSLADVALLEALERGFDIEMTQDDASQMRTISDVIRIVSQKIRPNKSALDNP